MTPSQTAELLGLCAAFDRRTIGKADVLAWQTVLGDIEFDAAKRAVTQHYATETRWIMPADIRTAVQQQRTSNVRDIHGAGQAAEVPDADPDDVPAYLAALRAQRTRAADGMELKPRPMKQLLAGVGHTVPTKEQPAQTALDVPCPHCEAPALRACRSGNGRRLGVYHPSRQEAARTNTSKETA